MTATLYGAVTGIAGVEATLTIHFYVGETMAPGQPGMPVLDPADGGLAHAGEQRLRARPTGARSTRATRRVTVIFDPPGPENTFVGAGIATQKVQLAPGAT